MKYYGLHWIADDGTPLQVRIETRLQEVWARSCPRGGEWTAWRRLDVNRNADNTLNETVANATNAKTADVATRLAKAVTINLQGAVTGTGTFTGANDIYINTTAGSSSGAGSLESKINALEQRVAALEGSNAATSEINTLKQKVWKLESDVSILQSHAFPGSSNN